MRLIMALVFLIFVFGKPADSDVNSNQAGLLIQEADGTNAGRYRVLIFCNGSLTNNGDGSVTYDATACSGSSGGNVVTYTGLLVTYQGNVVQYLGQ